MYFSAYFVRVIKLSQILSVLACINITLAERPYVLNHLHNVLFPQGKTDQAHIIQPGFVYCRVLALCKLTSATSP